MRASIILISLIAATFLSFISLSLAADIRGNIDCTDCVAGKCNCDVTNCEGIMRVWEAETSTNCKGIWDLEYTVDSDQIEWYPPHDGDYYLRIYNASDFCTLCTKVEVGFSEDTTGSTSLTTGPATTYTVTTVIKSPCPYTCCVSEDLYKDELCSSGYQCVEHKCEKGTTDNGKTGNNTWLLGLMILIVVLVIVAFMMTRRKKKSRSKTTYDDLYRKWPANRRRF
jgi:LPXTG-motif cell wall-anchored protein